MNLEQQTWRKETKAENPHRGGCMHCPGSHDLLELDTELYQGFGGYVVTKDGKLHYIAPPDGDFDACKKLRDIEADALADPNHDWRVRLDLPLRDAEWQRHGENEWVLIKSGLGFA